MEIGDGTRTNQTLADGTELSSRPEILRGTKLGRYIIIEKIGAGGMGSIYRAYDPELNRGVALKILTVRYEDKQAAQRSKDRLIREAQALATLAHPNVVAVHDVGSFGDDVFIAMELVEGKTLHLWLGDEQKSTAKILEVLKAAGRGLLAAHEGGLVHRDFKPGNVIVGDDGRVRVLDFGLARAVSDQEPAQEMPQPCQTVLEEDDKSAPKLPDPLDLLTISSSNTSNLLHTPLTQAGGVLGTPLYMAPEQHLGSATDARTDQFAFCVVLYEALYGSRPFVAKTISEQKNAVTKQDVRPPDLNSQDSAWIWPIVHKGLRAKPADRYPSMETLLQDLDHDPQEEYRLHRRKRRRLGFVFVLIILTFVLPIGVWYGLRYRTVQLCMDVEQDLAGVWDGSTQRGIQQAFLKTGKSFAAGAWQRVRKNFDSYLAGWIGMRQNVCEDSLLRATQSEELFDLRMSCLRKRLAEVAALTSVFARADASIVQKSVQASASLNLINTCQDEKTLRAPYPPAKTQEAQANVADIRKKLTEVTAYSRTGQYRKGLALVERLVEQANAVGYRPVQAEALYVFGELQQRIGKYKKAEVALKEAAQTAGMSRDIALAAKALANLVFVVGYNQARYEEGLSFGRVAQVVVQLGGGDKSILSPLLNNLGVLYDIQGDFHKALEHYSKALTIQQRLLGSEHSQVARTLNNMGLLYLDQGDYQKAYEYLHKTWLILHKTLGSQHPNVAVSLYNLGEVYEKQGMLEQSLQQFQKALEIWKNVLSPDHPHIAATLRNLASLFHQKQDHQRALQHYRNSLTIAEKRLAHDHPQLVWHLSGIGGVLIDLNRSQQALEYLARALAICNKKTCDAEPQAKGLFAFARALVHTGADRTRALALAQEARRLLSESTHLNQERARLDDWLKEFSTKTPAE